MSLIDGFTKVTDKDAAVHAKKEEGILLGTQELLLRAVQRII
jgi:hypothetical protein